MTRPDRRAGGDVGDDLLDDPNRLEATDSGGLLRGAASAGAQVRSTAASAADAGLARLAGARPRALVFLRRPGSPAAAASLLAALLGPSCPVPVVMARTVPMWVGALDVVLADTVDPGDRELAEDIDRAVRRGAQLVLSAPAEGPVAAAGAGRSMLLAPRVEVPPGLVLPRVLTAGLLLLDTLGLLAIDAEVLAGELDREAERDHIAHEALVNPAKSLALRLWETTPLLWGTDPVAAVVAQHAAASLAAHAGAVAHASGYLDAAALPVLRQLAKRASGEAELFRDPFEDPPEAGMPVLRPVLLGVPQDARYEPERAASMAEFPTADVVTADEELMVQPGDLGGPACAAAVLALRFDFAALYLGLSRGVLGGSGRIDSAVG